MKKNTTQVLLDLGMTVEAIAVAVNASASAVRNWRDGAVPRSIYRAALERLLDEKKAARAHG